jgi:ribonuclease P protein component
MSKACLPKHAKLLKAADYKFVFDKPVRSSDQFFTVLARSNNNPPLRSEARLGTAFSKKKVKLAVTRNRLKRISRESFRKSFNLALSKQDSAADYIILAGQQCTKATNQQLFQSLEKHWQRLIKKCAQS